jgi:hypothetical protein
VHPFRFLAFRRSHPLLTISARARSPRPRRNALPSVLRAVAMGALGLVAVAGAAGAAWLLAGGDAALVTAALPFQVPGPVGARPSSGAANGPLPGGVPLRAASQPSDGRRSGRWPCVRHHAAGHLGLARSTQLDPAAQRRPRRHPPGRRERRGHRRRRGAVARAAEGGEAAAGLSRRHHRRRAVPGRWPGRTRAAAAGRRPLGPIPPRARPGCSTPPPVAWTRSDSASAPRAWR